MPALAVFARAFLRRPLWVILTVWAVVASVFAGAVGLAAGRAMGMGLQRLLESAAGRPGQYDVLVQVRQERAGEAGSVLRSLARTALGGARVRQGPAVAGSASLLVDLPPQLEQGSTFQRLGQVLQGVPGYVAWVPLVEPAVVVDQLHPALATRLEREVARLAGVRFSFRHGGGVVVVIRGPQDAAGVTRWLQSWLRRFRLFRVTPASGGAARAAPHGPTVSSVTGQLVEQLERQGVRVVHVGQGRTAPSPDGPVAEQMVQLLLQYATTAAITYGTQRPELAPGDEVRVGPLRATVVQSGPGGALAVVTEGPVEPELAGQTLEVSRLGRAVGTARLQGVHLEVRAALSQAEAVLDRLQSVQVQASRATDLLEQALDQLRTLQPRLKGVVGTLERDRSERSSPDAVTETLVALALSSLLARRPQAAPRAVPPTGEPPADALDAFRESLASLQEQLSALSRGELAPARSHLRELRDKLPSVDGATLAAAVRALDPQGQASAMSATAEVLVEGSWLPAAAGMQQALERAVPGFAGRVHHSAAGLLSPSPRAAALALTERAQTLMGLAVAGLVVAYTFLNDWACVAAASMALLAGARAGRRRRARVGWQLAGALVGAVVAGLAGWLAASEGFPQAIWWLAVAGGVVGWLSARLAPRLSRVDPDPIEAGRAFGLEGSAILTDVVLPQARPWLLAWLQYPFRRLRGRPQPWRPRRADGDRARPSDGDARLAAGAVVVRAAPTPGGGAGPDGHRRSRPAPWAVLEAENVVKRFGHHTALEGFTLRLWAGETVALMGPSGCGKSTALRCLAGLCEPDDGAVRAFGRDLGGLPPSERRRLQARIAIVFQRPQLVGHLTALDNVALPMVAGGVPLGEARERAWACLDAVALAWAADRLPHQLSGGEGQRVAIARALARRPDVILWDEPTAHLDPARVAELLQLVQELARRLRTTMLIVTHQGRFACQVAHRLVLMDRGRVVEEGPPVAVLAQPRSDVGQRFAALAAF